MPEFEYVARELSGREVTGLLTANTEQDAVNSLAGKSLFDLVDSGSHELLRLHHLSRLAALAIERDNQIPVQGKR